MIGRRAALAGVAALAAAAPARAQLAPAPLPVMPGDTVLGPHERLLMLAWGDRVAYDAPPWDPYHPSAEAAEAQFGWDARIAALIEPPPATDGIPRAVLAVAHPTVEPRMAFPDGRDRPEVAAAMQGASLINVMRQNGRWLVVEGGYQMRRLAGRTLCRLSGPLAEGLGPLGTPVTGLFGITGGAATPWGTLLLCEGEAAAWLARVGGGLDPARYGWVAELDPLDPLSVPAKRTALGRFAQGDAAAALTRDGRAVVYLSDRRPGGFLFRFVSDAAATEPDALDRGTLFVARLEPAGGLRWLPLPAEAATWRDPVVAAGRLGASPFDAPSGLAADPRRARLFVACRGTPAAPGGPAGSVLEIVPAAGDHAAETGVVLTLLVGREPPPPPPPPQSVRGGPPPPEPPPPAQPAMPDTLAMDPSGRRLWIGTDHGGVVGRQADGLYACEVEGPSRGEAVPIYGAPRAAAVGGAAVSPDGTALFTVARRPGAEPGASFGQPGTRWPAFDPALPPRTALLALTRRGGGTVGG